MNQNLCEMSLTICYKGIRKQDNNKMYEEWVAKDKQQE
jgi:hypothetical protein